MKKPCEYQRAQFGYCDHSYLRYLGTCLGVQQVDFNVQVLDIYL